MTPADWKNGWLKACEDGTALDALLSVAPRTSVTNSPQARNVIGRTTVAFTKSLITTTNAQRNMAKRRLAKSKILPMGYSTGVCDSLLRIPVQTVNHGNVRRAVLSRITLESALSETGKDNGP